MKGLDELIQQPARLRIMATLAALGAAESVDFGYLRDHLDLTDGNLGAHLRKLEEAGYIEVEKTFVERRPKSFVRATDPGRGAFRAQVAALEEIIAASRMTGANRTRSKRK